MSKLELEYVIKQMRRRALVRRAARNRGLTITFQWTLQALTELYELKYGSEDGRREI